MEKLQNDKNHKTIMKQWQNDKNNNNGTLATWLKRNIRKAWKQWQNGKKKQ